MTEVGVKILNSEFQNGIVVVYFYPKDNTPGCTTEAKDFSSLLPEFQKLGIKVYGISKDDENSHKKFTEECNLIVPLIADIDGKICEEFGVIGEKTNFGKKYIGIIRSTFILKDGIVMKAWKSVTVAEHAKKVLEFVKTLV